MGGSSVCTWTHAFISAQVWEGWKGSLSLSLFTFVYYLLESLSHISEIHWIRTFWTIFGVVSNWVLGMAMQLNTCCVQIIIYASQEMKESCRKWSKDNIMVYGMQLQLVIRIVSYFISLPFCLLCKDSPNVCPLSGAYVWLKSVPASCTWPSHTVWTKVGKQLPDLGVCRGRASPFWSHLFYWGLASIPFGCTC